MWHLDTVPLKCLESVQMTGTGHRGLERCKRILVELVAWFGPLQAVRVDDEATDILRGIGIFGQGEQGGFAVLVGFELDGGIEEGGESRA